MIQKVIKVGNSLAVTIPRNVVKENNLRVGSSIELEIFPVGSKYPERLKFLKHIDELIERHRPALEELSRR